jgi:hypothetical protein
MAQLLLLGAAQSPVNDCERLILAAPPSDIHQPRPTSQN